MFITDPVDVVVQREVQIMEPVFRWEAEKVPLTYASLLAETLPCAKTLHLNWCGWLHPHGQGLWRQHALQRPGYHCQML